MFGCLFGKEVGLSLDSTFSVVHGEEGEHTRTTLGCGVVWYDGRIQKSTFLFFSVFSVFSVLSIFDFVDFGFCSCVS